MSDHRKVHGHVLGRPYAAAVTAGGLLFVSGAVAVDPTTGNVVGSDVGTQTEQVFKNLQSVVEAAGASWSDVAKVNVYLTDMALFSEMNAAYVPFFPNEPPARTTVGVSGLSASAFLVEVDIVVAAG